MSAPTQEARCLGDKIRGYRPCSGLQSLFLTAAFPADAPTFWCYTGPLWLALSSQCVLIKMSSQAGCW